MKQTEKLFDSENSPNTLTVLKEELLFVCVERTTYGARNEGIDTLRNRGSTSDTKKESIPSGKIQSPLAVGQKFSASDGALP